MSEYEEGMLIIAVYVFIVTVFTLPFLVTYLFVKFNRTLNRANKVLTFIHDEEIESRKYHE